MYKPLFLALGLSAALPLSARAGDVSALIRDKGLAGAEAALATSEDPNDRFARAGVVFLASIEKVWQMRWRYGLSDPAPVMPGMQAALPDNPAPVQMPPDAINAMAAELIDGMAQSAEILETLPPEADLAFTVTVSDLWFDVNANGARDEGEDFADVALGVLMSPWQVQAMRDDLAESPDTPNPLKATIRFDAADADWLLAYTHLIRGILETVLAFDPGPEVARTLGLRLALLDQYRAAMATSGQDRASLEAQFREMYPEANDTEIAARVDMALSSVADGAPRYAEPWKDSMAGWVDLAAVTLDTLGHHPDAVRVARAREHLLAMARLNRGFWEKVALETDNENEWIPNDRQTAALGYTLPPGTGETWLSVLADGEKILTGKLLVPYWRFHPGHGLNLAKWIDAPTPVAIVDWIQGTGALPYAEKGPVMTTESWRRFSMLVEGRAGLFAILLN